MSFLTIGIIWVNHHTVTSLIERADRRFLPAMDEDDALKWMSGMVAFFAQLRRRWRTALDEDLEVARERVSAKRHPR